MVSEARQPRAPLDCNKDIHTVRCDGGEVVLKFRYRIRCIQRMWQADEGEDEGYLFI